MFYTTADLFGELAWDLQGFPPKAFRGSLWESVEL